MGFFFLGAALLAIGMFLSSITESQGVAAGLCFVVMLVNYFISDLASYFSASAMASFWAFTVLILLVGGIFRLMTRNNGVSLVLVGILEGLLILGSVLGGEDFAGLFPSMVEGLSLFERFYQFVDGVFDLTSLVYFLTVIGGLSVPDRAVPGEEEVERMKLPTWRGNCPSGTGKKPARTPGRHLCGPAPSGWGGYSVAAAAIVVVIAVVANLLVNALPAGATQFDISAGSMFTMSQETEQLLDGLDQDITVYWLVQSGQEDETLGTLLDRYTSRSDRVTLEKRDPDVDPNFVQEYVTGTVYNNSLIVESEARYTYVSYEDIYTYEYGG